MARSRHSEPSTGLKTVHYGQVPPDFSYDFGSGARTLSGTFGKPVVLNFWATWCHPCLDELSAFEKAQQTFGDRVSVVTLSAEATGVARSFVTAHGMTLPVDEDPKRKVFDAYSIGPIPVTIVLDAHGAVTHVAVGELDWAELQGAISAVLPVPEASAVPTGTSASSEAPAPAPTASAAPAKAPTASAAPKTAPAANAGYGRSS